MLSTGRGAPATLVELFAAARPSQPDQPLLVLADGTELSYAALEDRSAQVAHALVGAGVAPGDRVAAQIEKSPMGLALYLACIRSGAVLLPMNPSYTDDEVAYLLADATPRLVVADPAAAAARAGATVLTLQADGSGSLADEADRMATNFSDATPAPTDPVVLLYTSGTTGRPKGALLHHGNLASNASALVEAWGFSSEDVLVHSLPMFHIHGLLVATNCVLASGSRMHFLPRFEPGAVLDALASASVMMGVPTYYHRLLADERLDRERCASVRLFVSGSAPLSETTFAAFEERTGHRILERYGMTETSMIASNPLHGERRAGTVGFPLPGVEVRITEEATGRALSPGEIGGIEVRGPNVLAGYLGRPELNATEFRPDGFFRTGDLGVFDTDGYLAIVGRTKDLVISGGLNVYPKEIEDVLDAQPGVEESAVVGLPDADFGEIVIAVVVASGTVDLDEAALRAACRLQLAAFKVPKRVVVVAELPRNTMGKVEKAQLRDQLAPKRA